MNTSEFDGNAAFAGGMPSQITQGADDSTSKELIVNVTKDTVIDCYNYVNYVCIIGRLFDLIFLFKDQEPKKKAREIKLTTSLKTVASLGLSDEKKLIMEKSIFSKFLQVKSRRESSATLISGLCNLYNPESKKFVMNNNASLFFCIREVVDVLGIENTGTDYFFPTEKSRHDKFLQEVREIANLDGKQLTTANLKSKLKDMPVDDDESRLCFRKLISFFIVDQFLVCSGDPKKPAGKSWGPVQDIDVFDKINWAKIVFEHTCDSITHLKNLMCSQPNKQHYFRGFAPILETIVYERIPSIRPQILEKFSDLLIEKYSKYTSNEKSNSISIMIKYKIEQKDKMINLFIELRKEMLIN
ncbi:unnamed protein product [Trifolium pratense]|uniref:Uncharacterized protein n=1 Tax=Trifolium pratense TaxID=57577 RepID=A0ACB0KNH1_TRIPR|nr:unnamed protein product [Trifolium pratense]